MVLHPENFQPIYPTEIPRKRHAQKSMHMIAPELPESFALPDEPRLRRSTRELIANILASRVNHWR